MVEQPVEVHEEVVAHPEFLDAPPEQKMEKIQEQQMNPSGVPLPSHHAWSLQSLKSWKTFSYKNTENRAV